MGNPSQRSADGTLYRPLFVMQVGRSESFERVGHSLFALLIAILGGLIARAFAARNEREAVTAPEKG